MHRLPRQRADLATLLLDPVDHVRGRRPERIHHQGRVVRKRHVQEWVGLRRRHGRGGVGAQFELAASARVFRQRRDVVLLQEIIDELPVFRRYVRLEIGHGQTAVVGALVLRGDDHVDAIGAVADLVLDPLEVDLERPGGVPYRTEYAQPSGLGDRGDHVAAMAEGKDRHVDPEHLGDGCLHGCSSGMAGRGRDRPRHV